MNTKNTFRKGILALLVATTTLVACSKDSNDNNKPEQPSTPHVTLKFDKQQVAQRKATLTIVMKKESKAFIDLDGNLKMDEGEAIENEKTYSITTEEVKIIGNELQGISYLYSDQLLSAEIAHPYIKEINISQNPSLTSVKVSNAPLLKDLSIAYNPTLSQVTLPADKKKIANLKVLVIRRSQAIQNRLQLFKSLPDRKGKEKGKILHGGNFTNEEDDEVLENLGWEAEW